MTENVKTLLEKVSADKALVEKLSTLDKEGLIAAAKELGIELSEADFAKEEGALDDQELDAVTGGDCLCVVAGGGTKDKDSKACGCVAAGAGYNYDGAQRCYCIMGGNGDADKIIHK